MVGSDGVILLLRAGRWQRCRPTDAGGDWLWGKGHAGDDPRCTASHLGQARLQGSLAPVPLTGTGGCYFFFAAALAGAGAAALAGVFAGVLGAAFTLGATGAAAGAATGAGAALSAVR